MNDILIHVGPSKTATTTLQMNVFPFHPGVCFLGKPFNPGIPERKGRECRLPMKEFDAIWQAPVGQFDEAAAKELFFPFVERAAGDQLVVISEEALAAGGPVVDQTTVGERLYNIFGKTRILLTIRNQYTAVPSHYLHNVREIPSTVRPFDRWIEAVSDPGHEDHWVLSQYLYNKTMDRFREIFGEESVVAVPYEYLTQSASAFAEALEGCTGIGRIETEQLLAEKSKQNVGLDEKGSVNYQRVASLTKAYLIWRQRLIPGFSLRRHLPVVWKVKNAVVSRLVTPRETGNRKNPANVGEEGRRRLLDFFGEDNQVTETTTRLPLRSLGYPVA